MMRFQPPLLVIRLSTPANASCARMDSAGAIALNEPHWIIHRCAFSGLSTGALAVSVLAGAVFFGTAGAVFGTF